MKDRTLRSFLKEPFAPYYLILFSVFALSAIGVVMVLSASSIKSLQDYGSSYAIFLKQLLFLGIALILGWLATHLKISLWHKLAKSAIVLGVGLLCLPFAPVIGKTINGNRNWVALGPFTIQPSEFAKFLLILWCAMQLTRFQLSTADGEEREPLQLIMKLAPGVMIFLGFIMAGKDLGTALIVMSIAAALLFVGGIPMTYFALLSGAGLVAVTGFVITQPNRLKRFAAVLDPFSPSVYKFAGWQPAHSVMGLASGGLFGVGLGASKQKWANLSEAHTDFIFSVIGEELGLLGTLAVLFLYAILIYAIFRTAIASKDLFFRYACAGIGAWMLLQVVVNIGSDIGLFPVVGVTLPFLSYGGSSLIANFIGVGFVINAIRRNPDLAERFRNKRKVEG